MGWFDPPHKKIIEKSPLWFQTEAVKIGMFIEAMFAAEPILRTVKASFRTVIFGHVVLAIASQREEWSPDALNYTMREIGYAERALNPAQRILAQQTLEAIASLDRGRPD